MAYDEVTQDLDNRLKRLEEKVERLRLSVIDLGCLMEEAIREISAILGVRGLASYGQIIGFRTVAQDIQKTIKKIGEGK